MKEHLTVIVIGRTNLKRFVNKCINLVSTLNLAFVVISVLYVINVQPCAGPCCYFQFFTVATLVFLSLIILAYVLSLFFKVLRQISVFYSICQIV